MSPQAVVTYAWALFQNGDQVRAEAAAQSLPDGSQLDSENGYFVAAIYAGRGKNEIASQMLKALLNNQRPFPMREQAEALLGKLQEEAGS